MLSDEVSDTSGNFVSAGELGSFQVAIGNTKPTAFIDSVSPDTAQPSGDSIAFDGHGMDVEGPITAWEWSSDLEGVLSTDEDSNISSDDLTVGIHQISYRVRDDNLVWSNPVKTTLKILNALPTAQMTGLPGVPVGPGATINLNLSGQDNDENEQSIQVTNLLLNGSRIASPGLGTYGFSAPVATGTYALEFVVQDDEGTWSDPAVGSFEVSAAGVRITESDDSTNVVEGGATDNYEVALVSAPTANVTIAIAGDSQVNVAPTTLTFTPTNWDQSQTVTVTAVNDDVDESTAPATHTGTITHTASSSDALYNGIDIDTVRLTRPGVKCKTRDTTAITSTTVRALDNMPVRGRIKAWIRAITMCWPLGSRVATERRTLRSCLTAEL